MTNRIVLVILASTKQTYYIKIGKGIQNVGYNGKMQQVYTYHYEQVCGNWLCQPINIK